MVAAGCKAGGTWRVSDAGGGGLVAFGTGVCWLVDEVAVDVTVGAPLTGLRCVCVEPGVAVGFEYSKWFCV